MGSLRFDRRRFLYVSGLAASSAVVAACAPAAAPTPAPVAEATATEAPAAATAVPATPAASPSRYNEAPMLAEMVNAGSLPPVEERLPKEPMVLPVTEEIGQYGGTWHRIEVGPGAGWTFHARMAYEPLIRWNEDGSGVVPNVTKAYEINDDATEYTFYLREGMRWSDGEPFTADDIVFWYEDGMRNEELTPTLPKWLRDPSNDEPMVLEKVDDYTVKMRFASSYGLLVQILAGPRGLAIGQWPKHYLTQFHAKYADEDELAKMTKDAGFDHWYQLFGQKRAWQNPEWPSICPWVPTRVPPQLPIVGERNAFYWKVDPEGSQLPYVDRVQMDIVENQELLNLKALAGEADMEFRHLLVQNYPLFLENAEKGDYRVLRWIDAQSSNTTLMLNMNHKVDGVKELMHKADFRRALSLAINRPEIRELPYTGFGTARQNGVIPQSPYFKPDLEKLYAEFDPDAAGQLLDDIGLTERDGEGMRLRLDGEALDFTIEYAPIFGPWRDTLAMIAENWRQVGVRATTREADESLLNERGYNLELDMSPWTSDGGLTPFVDPFLLFPTIGWDSVNRAGPWYDWYVSGGTKGEEPLPEAKELFDLYQQITAALPADMPPLAERFIESSVSNVWNIGTVGTGTDGVMPFLVLAKSNFRNIPEVAVSDWFQLTPGNTNVEQYFFKA